MDDMELDDELAMRLPVHEFDELDEEYDEEAADFKKIVIEKDMASALERSRASEYSHKVNECIAGLPPSDRAEFVRYPMSTPQELVLYHALNNRQGSYKGLDFKQGSCYDFGENKSFPTKDECDFAKTIPDLVEEFKGEICIIPLTKLSYLIIVPGTIINLTATGAQMVYDLTDTETPFRIMSKVKWLDAKETKMVDYVVYNNSFMTTSLKVQKQDCDIKLNYNDDLPDDRISKWLNSPESGLMVLHGAPGTGKTSYIRNLIYRTRKRFMFFDKSLFHHMSDASLVDMMLEHRDSVVVLEDCEDLLTDREGIGSCMTTILNLTDGIIGDSMKFKFICTFNEDIVNIDPAILRKGRMRLKYEFKKLAADKVVVLAEKLGIKDIPHEDMALCDVYNFADDNGKPDEKAKVGF